MRRRLRSATICWRRSPATAATSRPWLAGAQINRDRNLRLMYMAGLEAEILDEILSYRDYPAELFGR
jgi:hypothetical protein